MYVVLGAHRGEQDGFIDDNAIYQVVNSTDFVIHPEWNPETYGADVALIRLPEPSNFTGQFHRLLGYHIRDSLTTFHTLQIELVRFV